LVRANRTPDHLAMIERPFDTVRVAFNNPPVPWRDLERQLSGRPDRPSVHPDDVPRSQHRPEYTAPASLRRPSGPLVPYAELHAHSSFSFLDGASTPEELVEEAAQLGLEALALTDHDGFYGVVRFAEAADALGLPTIFGAELGLDIPMPTTATERAIAARVGDPDPVGTHLLALARDPQGYANLARTLSDAHLRGGAKGRPVYHLDEVAAAADGHWLVLTGCRKGTVQRALTRRGPGSIDLGAGRRALDELIALFGPGNVAVELTHALDPTTDDLTEALAALAEERRLPLVATTAAHYARPAQRPLANTVAAVRARSTLADVAGWLPAWAGQHLRSGAELAYRFARYPEAVRTAAALGRELAFPLRLIAPDLPPFPVPSGHTEMSYLRELAYRGAAQRYGTPEQAAARAAQHGRRDPYAQLDHELAIIEQLNFPGYFLVVWEIVEFCRSRGILCQGRGSAANSAVCYAIGITAVDSVRYGLLFERFLSPQREGPPDIDLDIESDRREEAIQHVYARYGRRYTAQVANVISYRPKSAIRDVARALGYSSGQQDAWSKTIEQGYYWAPAMKLKNSDRSVQQAAATANNPGDVQIPEDVLVLAEQLQKAPRHLGIHSGGMVICDRPIVEVCPVEWGRMPNRSVLQWDKDDCAGAGLVKFDLLGLGMLSALTYCFDFVEEWFGTRYGLHEIPPEDPLVYDMLCAADTVGVFQVESRAQMATLPRLKPRTFYDLVIEIALIRPGPIQGESVHPYIRRRNGTEPITYPHPRLKPALEKTLGVPLFQEQLMQLAIDAAGCSAAEADLLRKAMGSKRSEEKMAALRDRLYAGMTRNGITGPVADDIYTKIRAFAAFGFAESHAISFAFLVYASSWLKLYHPGAFCAALLNAQPMGFYSPQSLVQDAKRHGIVVRGPDVNLSPAGAGLEDDRGESTYAGPGPAQPAVRMGLSSVRSISADLAATIVTARGGAPFTSMTDLVQRAGLNAEQLETLAAAGAFDSLELSRRGALWAAAPVAAIRPEHLPFPTVDERAAPPLPEMDSGEQLIADYWATGVTRDSYPTAFIRERLDALGVRTAAALKQTPDRTRVLVGGVVTHRQRPNTAQGSIFINLEDETGMVNVICHPTVWNRNRRVARESGGLLIRGLLERVDGVTNVVAEKIDKLHLGVRTGARDFR
jgi:error-prone DNA polymerase